MKTDMKAKCAACEHNGNCENYDGCLVGVLHGEIADLTAELTTIRAENDALKRVNTKLRNKRKQLHETLIRLNTSRNKVFKDGVASANRAEAAERELKKEQHEHMCHVEEFALREDFEKRRADGLARELEEKSTLIRIKDEQIAQQKKWLQDRVDEVDKKCFRIQALERELAVRCEQCQLNTATLRKQNQILTETIDAPAQFQVAPIIINPTPAESAPKVTDGGELKGCVGEWNEAIQSMTEPPNTRDGGENGGENGDVQDCGNR